MLQRLLLIVCASAIAASVAHGQILNAGFENWTNGEPDDWQTSNTPPLLVNVSRSSDAHTGTYSLRGEVVKYSSSLFAPTLQNRSVSHKGSGVDHRVGALTGWLKFHSDSGDVFQLSLVAAQDVGSIGGGSLVTSTDVTQWDQFTIPIAYTHSTYIPDTVLIFCMIQGPQGTSPHLGTWFQLDDLAFADPVDGVTGNAGASGAELSVWPNPATEFAQARVLAPVGSAVKAVISDATGRVVWSRFVIAQDERGAMIPVDARAMGDGVYYLRIETSGRVLGQTLVVRH